MTIKPSMQEPGNPNPNNQPNPDNQPNPNRQPNPNNQPKYARTHATMKGALVLKIYFYRVGPEMLGQGNLLVLRYWVVWPAWWLQILSPHPVPTGALQWGVNLLVPTLQLDAS